MIQLRGSVFGRHFCFLVTLPETIEDVDGFLLLAEKEVTSFLTSVLQQSRKQFKVTFHLNCIYEHEVTEERMDLDHDTPPYTLLTEDDVISAYRRATSIILQMETEFQASKSQWYLVACKSMHVNLYTYNPLSGGGNCALEKIKACKSIVNISNVGNQCFKFAVNAKYIRKNPTLKRSYFQDPEFERRFKWPDFPVRIDDIDCFESLNNTTINVFTINPSSGSVETLRLSKRDQRDPIDLLFFQQHYMNIKNFDRFMSFMEDRKELGFYCNICLLRFPSHKKMTKHKPLCMGHPHLATLPEALLAKQAVTLMHCHPRDSFRTSLLSNQEEYDCDWSDFTRDNLTIEDIKRFEKRHPAFDITVYSFNEAGTIYPLKASVCDQATEKVRKDLLLSRENGMTHFHVIHDISRLLTRQATRKDGKHFYCRRCFSRFTREDFLAEHLELCKDVPIGKAIIPRGDQAIRRFKDYKKKQRVPVVCYLDFESLLIPMEEKIGSSTTRYQRHEVSSFCLYTVSIYEPDREPIVYRGPNAAEVCLQLIEEEVENTTEIYSMNEPLQLTKEERRQILEVAKYCHICERPLNGERTIDHDHVSSKLRNGAHAFRGVTHGVCNRAYTLPSFVPVFVHNLSYDIKFLVQAMASRPGTVRVIPSTEEKYISLMRRTKAGALEYRFVDTFRFLPASLSALVEIQTPDGFKHTARHFPSHLLPLLRRKGVYPYDYMDSWARYEETKLPRIEDFYSQLNKESLPLEDYAHAQKVWVESGVTNLGEFTDFYNKGDTTMLADIFENFRDTMMREYKLDPAWCFTLPAYGMDAYMYSCKVHTQLLQDINMIHFMERGVRGGYACVSHRYSEAKNKYLGDSLTNGEASSQIIMLDCNALYAWALSQKLPKDSFRWMLKRELADFDVLKTADEDDWGFVLETDLFFPPEIHDVQKDFPMCPEVIVPPLSHEAKLCGTLWEKKNYVIHIRALRQALQHGVVLKKLHRGITFRQEAMIRPFIEKTTKLRQKATTAFDKDLFKLVSNSLYGKHLESVHKRLNVEIVTNAKRYDKIVRDNFFKKATIFNENLAAMHRTKKYVCYDRPQFVGQAVLDIAKTKMNWFWFEVLKPRYGDDITLLMTDTDSLCFELRNSRDFYEDMRDMMQYLDTSDYPPQHPMFSLENKKKIGLFKEEYNSVPIRRFTGLRAKNYVIETVDDAKKRVKGVKKSVAANEITPEDFKECLLKNKDFSHEQNTIASKKLVLYSIKTKKKSLSSRDDKRYIMRDGISTLPHGHYSIVNHQRLLEKVHEELRHKVSPHSPIEVATNNTRKRKSVKHSGQIKRFKEGP